MCIIPRKREGFNMEEEKYLLGLDIGTNSVGWCLTDKNYNVIKKQGKSLWGVRLFEEANTAADRRMHRANRRRLFRRKERINLLKDLFAEEIAKVDNTFLQRLSEAQLHHSDKKIKTDYLLFNDINYSDKDFYHQYPTIYHLINDLIKNDKKYDIRLVYLACAFLIKYRGHFLYEGEFKTSSVADFSNYLNSINVNVNTYYGDISENIFAVDNQIILDVIQDAKNFHGITDLKAKLSRLIIKDTKFSKVLISVMSGGSVKVSNLISSLESSDVDASEETLSIDVKEEKFEENIATLKAKYPSLENIFICIEQCKNIYDFIILNKLLKDKKYLCEAMIARYDEHKSDLKELKSYIKKNYSDKYYEIFRKYPFTKKGNKTLEICNYVHYIGSNNNRNKVTRFSHCKKEDFYKYLKGILGLDKIKKADDINDEFLKSIYLKMSEGTYLLRQNGPDNGVFPYQINLMMLKGILDNQSKYYQFLSTSDEDGSVNEKIISLMKFKIPYYVGPLYNGNDENRKKFAWVVRKEEKIYPWNFDRVVDKYASAEAFIKRMQNKCTYLSNEECLPKESLLYSEYNVLSELNKLCVNGVPLDLAAKNYLIEELYEKRSNVTKKMVIDCLKTFYNSKNIEISTSNSKEMEEIHASLKSRYDFINIFGKDYFDKHIDEIEDIIYNITMFEDKDILKSRLQQKYSFEASILSKILKLNYKGWGRISRKLLAGLPAADKNGEIIANNIISIMRNSNQNLMEILYDSKYNYQQIIEDYNNKFIQKDTYDIESMKRYIDDLYTSPMMKRSLIQTCKIILELEKIIRHPINEFYIECTREHEEKKVKGNRKDSRYEAVKKLLDDAFNNKNIQSDNGDLDSSRKLLKEKCENDPSMLRSDYIYLYFTQLGRCVYTGQKINFDDLINGNLGKYDIDHIYPQSLVKDDSLDNRVLVVSEANRLKSDKYPIKYAELKPIDGYNAFAYAKFLSDHKFISQEKYHRLTRRTTLTDDDLKSFINRQLVSTSQSVKAVADLLRHYKKDALVVYSKANAVSDFRQTFDIIKCREANDYHHAHDAYLNIVVGRVLHEYFRFDSPTNQILRLHEKGFTSNPKKVFIDNENKNKLPLKSRNGDVIWDYQKTIDKVKKQIFNHFDIFVTTRAYIGTTLFAKESIKPARDAQEGALPLKKNGLLNDIKKYGGYSDLSFGSYMLVESDSKKGKKYSIETIPTIYTHYSDEEKLAYLVEEKKLENPKIILPILKVNTVIKSGHSKFCITGKTNDSYLCKNLSEANFNKEELKLIKLSTKALEKLRKIGVVSGYKILEDTDLNEYGNEFLISAPRTNKNSPIIVTLDEMKQLFNALTNKLGSNIYEAFSPIKTICETLRKKEYIEMTNNFNLIQYIVLNQSILNLIKCDRTLADLSIVGLSSHSGVLMVSKNINISMQIISESITGYYTKALWSNE